MLNVGFLGLVRALTCHYLNGSPISLSLFRRGLLSKSVCSPPRLSLFLLQSRSIDFLSRFCLDLSRRSNRDHSIFSVWIQRRFWFVSSIKTIQRRSSLFMVLFFTSPVSRCLANLISFHT